MSSPATTITFFFFFFTLSSSFYISSSLQTNNNNKHTSTVNSLNIPSAVTEITLVNPKLPPRSLSLTSSKKFEGSSNLVHLRYHMGPVLSSSPINIYVIWYGQWSRPHKSLIRDFLNSISDAKAPSPSVSEWWRTASLYTDQTGSNVSRSVLIAGEYSDSKYSHGQHLTRLTIQEVIASAARSASFPVDHKNGMYLVLTSHDVTMQDFCRAVCGFHYFTFPSMVGYTMPYAWVGQSGKQCPEVCAYPFALPGYMGHGGPGELRPPNGETGVDGMVSVIGHELAEVVSNPLINAWYAGEDPTAPTEIGDLCEGLYGSGGGGGYIGQVMRDREGKTFNMNGKGGRKFLVQWIWNPNLKACSGPNSVD
ncbi:Protein EXORDIUM-like [Arabidopsis suecica]|uniref:Protein EXORDIUM-like n=1 Tax=Arabidopsis suecica TaxID=45249 RepID=A0A8T2GCW2_ARASU|nr:Protein EXORDIUM-like [Arabidopsis suecica]